MRNKPFTTPNSDLFTLFFHASELTIFKLFVCVELCENNVTFVCVELCGNFVANMNHKWQLHPKSIDADPSTDAKENSKNIQKKQSRLHFEGIHKNRTKIENVL